MQLDKNEAREVFIDTTSIKISDDQISVWVLDIFNKAEEMNDDGLKVKRSRTQYLFNIANNTYSVIGNLYYDEVGKIISQQYNPRIGGIGRSFYQQIDGNPIVNNLYTNLTNYLEISVQRPQLNLTTSNRADERERFQENSQESDTSYSIQEDEIINSDDEIETEQTNILTEPPRENVAPSQELKPIEFKKENDNTEVASNIEDAQEEPAPIKKYTNPNLNSKIAQIYDPITGEYIELRSKTIAKPENDKVDLADYKYNLENEKSVTNTIFSDGKVFCFQVSSWKQKRIAENEVRKLKQKGHNAYIVAATPKHKRGTWYRVRIGYFNSQTETEDYRKSM